MTERTRIDLEYYTYSRDNMTRRKVDPHLVFASLGHWYFSGYCHLSEDKRMFRLDRIKSLELTDETLRGAGRRGRRAAAAARLRPRPGRPAGPHPGRQGRSPQWLGEYFPIESTKDLEANTVELEFRTSAFPWLEKLLLRFGSDVEVVEPMELADRMRAAAADGSSRCTNRRDARSRRTFGCPSGSATLRA